MNKSKLNIIYICTIIVLAIGFILVSLKVGELSNKKIVHRVVFSDVSLASAVKGSSIDPVHNYSISEDKTEVSFNYGVNYTHDEIVYNAVIKNDGNVDCEIVKLVESPDYSMDYFNRFISPVTIKVTDVKGKVLKPGEEIPLKITVYYNPSTQEVSAKNFPYKISLITKAR
ncbi:MAG: hypothetical protein IJ842_03245 [Bacilli bacterium]|nr:hypothetical protein [Bacilli bacterium]